MQELAALNVLCVMYIGKPFSARRYQQIQVYKSRRRNQSSPEPRYRAALSPSSNEGRRLVIKPRMTIHIHACVETDADASIKHIIKCEAT